MHRISANKEAFADGSGNLDQLRARCPTGGFAVGFPTKIAAQLAAAFGELYSNVYEHSGAPATGLVAFQAANNHFEFVVSDRGTGALESLRSCDDYVGLNDYGEALRLTLADSVSRHGVNADRGHGFRPLFVGLANLNGTPRFRSGDHALVIDGGSLTLISARAPQKPYRKGLMISVACERRQS